MEWNQNTAEEKLANLQYVEIRQHDLDGSKKKSQQKLEEKILRQMKTNNMPPESSVD